MSTYSNIALYDLAKKTGVIDLADQDMVGSVAYTLGGESAAAVCSKNCDDFFAIRLAFNCGSTKFCINIPLLPGTNMAMVERAYLNPLTLAGPDEKAMVPFELLVFKQREIIGVFGGWVGEYLEALLAWQRTLRGAPAKLTLKLFVGATLDSIASNKETAGAPIAVLLFVTVKIFLLRSRPWRSPGRKGARRLKAKRG